MPSCPFCQTELADDFGLLDCPGCEASLFIEMDGSVRSTQEDAEAEAPDDFAMPADPTVVEPPIFEEPPPEEEASIEEESSYEEEQIPAEEPIEESIEESIDDQLEVPPAVADHLESTDMAELATAIDQRGVIDGLRYNLKISGIDTANLRHEIFEAFADKKLGWDAEEIVNSISGGVLELKAVSAVKAHVIIQRLKIFPLQIRWDQYADS